MYAGRTQPPPSFVPTRIKRIPPAKRVYVDESGISEHPQREFGRAPRPEGRRNEARKARQPGERHWRAARRAASAHGALRTTTTAGFFEHWLETRLLQAIPWGEGHTVILDNAGFHRKKALGRLARGKVRLLFLPPHSPDCNRIEKAWANMKRFSRGNMDRFASVEFAVYAHLVSS